MYIIIFEDGSIRSTEKIDDGLLDALQDNLVDIVNPKEMKILNAGRGDDLVWEDIKQI
jgi:hypothetical protein